MKKFKFKPKHTVLVVVLSLLTTVIIFRFTERTAMTSSGALPCSGTNINSIVDNLIIYRTGFPLIASITESDDCSTASEAENNGIQELTSDYNLWAFATMQGFIDLLIYCGAWSGLLFLLQRKNENTRH